MIAIDISALQNWPDPDAIMASADEVALLGEAFLGHLETAYYTWKGLTACYETPHQLLLYSALDTALMDGVSTRDGCLSVMTAMTIFADTVRSLIPERNHLITTAESHSAYPAPLPHLTEDERRKVRIKERLDIEAKIGSLAEKYRAAIDACSSELAAIGDNGLPESANPGWDMFLASAATTATGTLYDSITVAGDKYFKVFKLTLFNSSVTFSLPGIMLTGIYDTSFTPSAREARMKFHERTRFRLRQQFLGPVLGPVGRQTLLGEPKTLLAGRQGRHATRPSWLLEHQTKMRSLGPGTPAWARFTGRAMFLADIYLTWIGEEAKVRKRVMEEQPHLSAEELEAEVDRRTAVRTATKVTTTATGSTLAVVTVGTVVSLGPVGALIIALSTGFAMNWDFDGDGRAFNDWFADRAEDAYGIVTSDPPDAPSPPDPLPFGPVNPDWLR